MEWKVMVMMSCSCHWVANRDNPPDQFKGQNKDEVGFNEKVICQAEFEININIQFVSGRYDVCIIGSRMLDFVSK